MGTELQTQQAQPPALRISETIASIKTNVQMVQHLMRELMVPDVHYGLIPGTQKKSLYQPGAELIGLTFHWSTRYVSEDLSYTDVVRYRVTCELYSRDSGEFVGSGPGEASSDEEKYRWRKIVCDAEFDETPEDRRRTVWKKGKAGSSYQVKQVRIEPADIANTVLKMAAKRAFIGATRTASACSDMFTQDLEDMSPELRQAMGEESAPSEPPKPIGDKDWKKLMAQAKRYGYSPADLMASAATAGHEGTGPEIPDDLARRLFCSMRDNPAKEEPKEEPAITVDPETGEIIPDECAEPVPPVQRGFKTPLGDD